MDSGGIKTAPWSGRLPRFNNHRYFADFYDADGTYYVFDHENGGQEVAGPFDSITAAYVAAYKLNHPPRTVLVHLNVQVPVSDERSPEKIAELLMAAITVGSEDHESFADLEVSVALTQEL